MHGMRNTWLLPSVCIVVVIAACSSGGGGNGAAPAYTPYVTNGPVYAVVVADDGTTYIGGQFTQVGPATGGGVPIDASTGQASSSFPKIAGAVHAAAADGSGGMYIGGAFTHAGGLKRSNLAHILSDGTVDASWDPGTNGPVNALAVSGSTVYAGGNFTALGSSTTTTRNHLAAIDATGAVTSWDPDVNGVVNTLGISGSTVYVGGAFSALGSAASTTTRNGLAALDSANGAATTWNPNTNGAVYSLIVSGSTVYAGGYFTTLGSAATLTTRRGIAAIDAASGAAMSWNPDANDAVLALALSGNTVYAGGYFTTLGSSPTATRNHIAAIDATSGAAAAWDPGANNTVYALAVDGNTVYAGGYFTTLGSSATITRNYMAAIDAATGTATSWDPKANNRVLALAVNANTVYAGGYFTSVNCSRRNNLAALDANGAVTAWDPNMNAQVWTLAVSGNTVYASGLFSTLGSAPTTTRHYLAAINAGTGAATAWDPNPDGPANALSVNGNTVYAGGYFTTLGSGATTTRNFLAAIDAGTGAATAWDPNPNGPVEALAVSGSTVYAGGVFSTLGSSPTTTRKYLAAIDTSTGAATPWNPDPNSVVFALAVSGTTVYTGGFFTTMGSAPATERRFLAAVNAATGAVTSWNPEPNLPVTRIATDGSTVYVGGMFTTIGSAPTTTRNNIAALDATGAATSWAPELSSPFGLVSVPALRSEAGRAPFLGDLFVNALAVSGNSVYVGGFFGAVGPDPLSYYARISK